MYNQLGSAKYGSRYLLGWDQILLETLVEGNNKKLNINLLSVYMKNGKLQQLKITGT
jgi:hypothetical protein